MFLALPCLACIVVGKILFHQKSQQTYYFGKQRAEVLNSLIMKITINENSRCLQYVIDIIFIGCDFHYKIHYNYRIATKLLLLSGYPHIFKNHFPHFFNTFSILNLKTLIPSFILIFQKFYSWNTMQKTSAELSSVEKNKI